MIRPAAAGSSGRMLLPGWWGRLTTDGRRRLLVLLVHAAIVAGLVGGVWYGLRAADRYVRGLDRYQGPIKVVLRAKTRKGDLLVTTRPIKEANLPEHAAVVYRGTVSGDAGRIVVEHDGRTIDLDVDDCLPEWLARFQYVGDNLRGLAGKLANQPAPDARHADWFDAAMAERIARGLAADPFVEKVVQVEKQLLARDGSTPAFDRRVVVTVVLRKPLAHVFINQRGYLLDSRGAVLERRDNLIGLPQVADFQVLPDWRAGVTVGSPMNAADVQAGLDLLAKLTGQPFYPEVSEVSVANYDGRRNRADSELVLRTRPLGELGVETILWGLRQDNDAIERNDSRAKIQILNDIQGRYGRLNLKHIKKQPYDLFHVAGRAFWVEQTPSAGPGGQLPPAGRGGRMAGRP